MLSRRCEGGKPPGRPESRSIQTTYAHCSFLLARGAALAYCRWQFMSPNYLAANVAVELPSDLPSDLNREISQAVHLVFDHIPGEWTLAVQRASYERGRWRLELRGPTGKSLWTFLGSELQLPETICRTLKAFVRVASTAYQRRTLAQRRAS
jgi:hypothetical protein